MKNISTSVLLLLLHFFVFKGVHSSCPHINQSVYHGHIEQPLNASFGDEAKVICEDPYVISNKRNDNITILKCQHNETWNGQIPNCKPKTTKNLVYSYNPRKNHSMYGTVLKQFPVTSATAAGECSAKCWKDVRCLLFNLISTNYSKNVICQMLDIPFGEIQPSPSTNFYDFIDPSFCATYIIEKNTLTNNTHWNYSNATVHLARNGSTAMLECDVGWLKSGLTTSPQITCSSGLWIGDQTTSVACIPVGKVLLIGSSDSSGNNNMEIYNINFAENNIVIDIPLLGKRCTHVSGVFDNGTVVIAGGEKNGSSTTDTQFYDQKANKLSSGPNMNEVREYAAAAMLNNEMIVCGGYNPSSNLRLSTCEKLVFNMSTDQFQWTSFPPISQHLANHAMVQFENDLFVMGGFDDVCKSRMERYSPPATEWSIEKPMIYSRKGPSAAVLKGFIFVCGGCCSTKEDKCEKYNPLSDIWISVMSMNTESSYFNLISFNGNLYAFNSDEGKGVETYNPENNTWSNMSKLLIARRVFSSAVLLK